MKTLHISDLPNHIFSFPLICNSPQLLLEEIKEKYSDTDLFIINVNYKTEDVRRVDNAGILFLKFLRLNNFTQHCVIYSFLSREQLIKQNPQNLIIFSEGVTFVHMPQNLENLDFNSLAEKKAPKDMSNYFIAEVKIVEEDRHNWANFWGIYRLWMVHKHVEHKFKAINVENLFSEQLKSKINSYEGILLRYFYKHNDSYILESLTEQSIAIENYFNEALKPIFKKVNLLFDDIESCYHKKDKILIEKKIVEIQKLLRLDDRSFLNNSLNVLKEDVSENEFYEFLSNSKIEVTNFIESFKYQDFTNNRLELRKKNPSVIYIDDQANLGWSDILQEIIYGSKNDNFNVIIPKKDDTVDEIKDSIESKIIELTEKMEPPQLIIVDMRLKGEEGFLRIEEISGVKVLDFILKKHIKIPVLVFTASNKSRLYIHIKDREFSPRGFWIKEGIDQRYNEKESVNNYIDLVAQLNNLIRQKEDYKKREKKANTVRNAVNKEKAVEELNKHKSLHYYSDEEINEIISKENFNENFEKIKFENLIVDTNYFCSIKRWELKNNNEIVVNLQFFILLANLYKKFGKKIFITYRVLNEITKHGMTITNYANPNVAARFSFQMFKKLYEEKKISLIFPETYSVDELSDILSAFDTYADPEITRLFIKYRKNNNFKNISLITDDRELRYSIEDELKNIGLTGKIFWSSEFNKKLKVFIE